MDSRPRLIFIPSADAQFARDATRVFERTLKSVPSGAAAEAFADQLRRMFPTAVVRPRDPLASVSPEEGPVWYVIRRGFAARIVANVDINAPREQVFDTYVNRMPEWQVAVQLHPLNKRPGLVGTEFGADYEFLGLHLRGRMRIVDASPPRAVRVEAEGMGVSTWYVTTFRSIAEGTRVEVAGDYSLPTGVIPAAIERLAVERRINADIERAHAALRDLCMVAAASDGRLSSLKGTPRLSSVTP